MSKVTFLRDRARMLQEARFFFAERKVLEVDCPALSFSAPVDQHIDVMKVMLKKGAPPFLHTSPEYGMKRLLSYGTGDIYQISHVFREGESGPLHNPEFTLAEWYRCGFTFPQMIVETLQFIRLFLGDLPSNQISYREAFKRYLHIDYLLASRSDLISLATQHAITLSEEAHSWDKDTLLQLLMSFIIEPHLGKNALLVLLYFPATQAALAKTTILPETKEVVALRFEVYYQGIELANGYHELTDPHEQRRRFEEVNNARAQAGKERLIIDEKFLNALQRGIPDCCGVAVGFDRLMALRHQQHSLANILPFSWDEV